MGNVCIPIFNGFTWLVLLGASDAPADDTGQHESFVATLDHHRTAGVALQGWRGNCTIPGIKSHVKELF